MATRKVLLKEDRTGLDALNYIVNESKSIGTGRNRLLVPEYGAFFTENFQLKDEVGTVINRSKYMFCELYQEATRNSGKEVWNSVVILDENLPDTLIVSYHAYGGKFSVNAKLLTEWVDEKLATTVDPIAWSDLVDKPREYEPSFHYHLWKEVYSFDHLRRPLVNIENAIRLEGSFFFDSLINQIKQKLIEAEERAFDIAKFYAIRLLTEQTVKITKVTLDINLLANLSIASEEEMTNISKTTFDDTSIVTDKYINKKGLMAFTKGLKDRSVSKEATGLGLTNIRLSQPSRGSVLFLGNGGVTTFESKKKIVEDGNFYEENVYPKNYPDTDRFTVVRVTNNLEDHGGVFLGFNNNTGEMYSGVLKVDTCYKRLEWYRFYSDIAYDSIKGTLLEHINAKNNPHKLTKKHVELENVVNLPVVTAEQILGDEPSDSYITLDALSLFMTKHLLNLKPEFNEDGTLNKDGDLFNKPNIIFTPCDKKPPGTYPAKGMILKAFCLGTDRFTRVADGIGGFTEQVLELNSDDCKYFEILPQGTVINESCDGANKTANIADGRGGFSKVLMQVNSEDCGYIAPPVKGTVLGTKCEGVDEVTNYADGVGGSFDVITTVKSAKCGYVAPTTRAPVVHPPAGTVLRTKCVNYDLYNVIADGNNRTTDELIARFSETCGFFTRIPNTTTKTPSVISERIT